MIFIDPNTSNAAIQPYFSPSSEDNPSRLLDKIPSAKAFCTCITQCVPSLPVFTDEVGTDYWKNDLTSFWINTLNTTVPVAVGETITGTITNIDTGVAQTLVNATHGTLKEGNYYWWFTVDWTLIQDIPTLGYGRYQIEIEGLSVYSSSTVMNEFCSPVYQLKPWSEKLANRTIRLETSQSGKLHHGNDYSVVAVKGNVITDFTQQIRLPGSLKFSGNDNENDHLVLNNSNRSTYQIKDQIRPKYELTIDLVSSLQMMSAIFDDLFSNPVNVSDYNVYNWVADPRDYQANQYKSIPLIRESTSFDADSGALRKSFTFGMNYANDNVFKTNN